jgi:iron(III) transport system permease protein
MVIAWLVVRKTFSGKEALDFSSNLGGAVPGTILGIGFVMVFNKPPLALAVVIYALLALFFVLLLASMPGKDWSYCWWEPQPVSC